jgi:mRNA-degrading endonuclease RelE of RelBE toxin-antitoxin system
MPDLHSLPAGSWPQNAIRNNGPDELALERYKLRELAEGWPCYRYRNLRHEANNKRRLRMGKFRIHLP